MLVTIGLTLHQQSSHASTVHSGRRAAHTTTGCGQCWMARRGQERRNGQGKDGGEREGQRQKGGPARQKEGRKEACERRREALARPPRSMESLWHDRTLKADAAATEASAAARRQLRRLRAAAQRGERRGRRCNQRRRRREAHSRPPRSMESLWHDRTLKADAAATEASAAARRQLRRLRAAAQRGERRGRRGKLLLLYAAFDVAVLKGRLAASDFWLFLRKPGLIAHGRWMHGWWAFWRAQ